MDITPRILLRKTVTTYCKLLGSAISKGLEEEFGIFQNGMVGNAAQLGHLSAKNQDYRQHMVVHLKQIITGGLKTQQLVKSLSGEA